MAKKGGRAEPMLAAREDTYMAESAATGRFRYVRIDHESLSSSCCFRSVLYVRLRARFPQPARATTVTPPPPLPLAFRLRCCPRRCPTARLSFAYRDAVATRLPRSVPATGLPAYRALFPQPVCPPTVTPPSAYRALFRQPACAPAVKPPPAYRAKSLLAA